MNTTIYFYKKLNNLPSSNTSSLWQRSDSKACALNYYIMTYWVSHVALVIKSPPANTEDIRDAGSISGWGRSPRVGDGKPLQHSCLGNAMDRVAWWATVHGVAKSWTRPTEHIIWHNEPEGYIQKEEHVGCKLNFG